MTTSTSFLEFGHLDICENFPQKQVWGIKTGPKAYEWFMLARYINDLFSYERMATALEQEDWSRLKEIFDKEIHHNNDAFLNLQKYIALTLFPPDKQLSFYELGQTLFGCIEGMEFVQRLIEKIGIDIDNSHTLQNIKWAGFDISPLFNSMATKLHKGMDIHTTCDPSEIPTISNVFFAKGVTLLYAIKNCHDFMKTINKGMLSLFDYSFSPKGSFSKTIGTGVKVHYLDVNDFMKKYKKTSKIMYVRKYHSKITNDGLIYIEGIYGEKELCENFIKKDYHIREDILKKLHLNSSLSILLHPDQKIYAEKNSMEWLNIEDFLNKNNK